MVVAGGALYVLTNTVLLTVSGCSFITNTAQIQQSAGTTGYVYGGAVYVMNNYGSTYTCLFNSSSFTGNVAAALAPSTYSTTLVSYIYGASHEHPMPHLVRLGLAGPHGLTYRCSHVSSTSHGFQPYALLY